MFVVHSSVSLCVKPFLSDDWDLSTRQTGGFDEGGEDNPLRQRMIEDMRIRGMAEKTQAVESHAELSRFWSEPLGLDQRGASN